MLWDDTTAHLDASDILVWPGRTPRELPDGVPGAWVRDYWEACIIATASPKASAALSRRIPQAAIREQAGISGRDLNAEIETLITSKALPTELAEDLHAVRMLGNFAAHPMKDIHTGEVVEVEQGEARDMLVVLEALLQWLFVDAPRHAALRAQMRSGINDKLARAGKPPLPGDTSAPEPTA